MNWGKSIVLAFILFAAFIATLVAICVRQEVSLVTADYYRDELAYQKQIDRIKNTDSLGNKPQIARQGNFVKVTFSQFSRVDAGDLQLFRPSDARLDRKFEFAASEASSRYFPIDGLKTGMYRARMEWTMEGKQFFLEQVIYL